MVDAALASCDEFRTAYPWGSCARSRNPCCGSVALPEEVLFGGGSRLAASGAVGFGNQPAKRNLPKPSIVATVPRQNRNIHLISSALRSLNSRRTPAISVRSSRLGSAIRCSSLVSKRDLCCWFNSRYSARKITSMLFRSPTNSSTTFVANLSYNSRDSFAVTGMSLP